MLSHAAGAFVQMHSFKAQGTVIKKKKKENGAKKLS